jgi:hypothetical protein
MQVGKAARNGIVEAIDASDFDIRSFVREEGDEAISVRHEPSGSEMVIKDGGFMRYDCRWTIPSEEDGGEESENLLAPTARWLIELGESLATADRWSEIPAGPGLSSLMAGQDNSTFNAQELVEIRTWAKQAKEQSGLSGDQLELLEAKLDYAVEAASRTGRLDWLNLTAGAVLGAFAGDLLTPSVARQVFQLLVSSVGHLFGHALPQLPA